MTRIRRLDGSEQELPPAEAARALLDDAARLRPVTATGVSLAAWSVNVPLSLAGMELSKNGRVHWRVQRRAFAAQRDYVIRIWQCEQSPELREHLIPWQRAWLFVDWRYRLGRQPDDDNIISRVSACRDAFQHIGLVRDDAVIETGLVQWHKVAKGEECAVVTLIGDEDMAREYALRTREGRS